MIESIVLAAGLGTRMGASKPLLDIDGRPALSRVLDTLCAAGPEEPIVVLGHRAAEVRRAVDLSFCRIVVNDEPRRGMGTSLRLGLRAVRTEAIGALVFHVDMPLVRPTTVRRIREVAIRGAPLVAPVLDGSRGFPVFFGRATFADLLPTLVSDVGGRTYLAAHEADLVLVPVDDPGIRIDFDRPCDLDVLRVKGEA